MERVSRAADEGRRGRRGIHYRIYDWVLRWSGDRHAQAALFLLAAAEASFFPVPPDVLLIAMCLARPRRAARFAGISTVGSVLGGLGGYGIGWGAWRVIGPFCLERLGALGFTPENFARVQQAYQDNAAIALFTAGFTPIPYKVFTIAAGVFEVALPTFLVASVLGRAGRFFLVALLIRWLGPSIKPFLDRYLGWLTLAFVGLLVLGFWLLARAGG